MKYFITVLIVVTILTFNAVLAQRCENGKFVTCGSACESTCQNHRNPPRACTLQCVRGCACNAGYVKLNSRSNRCVRPRQCPRH
ncbi:venom peptide SjAPI-2-like [Oppia nitens]|uniref:venom peptide SjAPI-2-like n=1 Tax=Oppia nitens TaxID=1686743 RepID=UPI0023DCB480|nr:venom peptide SjAPI-2-like [Oppia nitens]